MMDMLEKDIFEIFKDGMMVEVDAVKGEVRF
jgi:hypothetical protein